LQAAVVTADSATKMMSKYMKLLALIEWEDGEIIIHGFSFFQLHTLYKASHRNAKCEMAQDGLKITYKLDISFIFLL
jgi:hypothetical protein